MKDIKEIKREIYMIFDWYKEFDPGSNDVWSLSDYAKVLCVNIAYLSAELAREKSKHTKCHAQRKVRLEIESLKIKQEERCAKNTADSKAVEKLQFLYEKEANHEARFYELKYIVEHGSNVHQDMRGMISLLKKEYNETTT